MTAERAPGSAVKLYVGFLTAVLVAVLTGTLIRDGGLQRHVAPWLFLIVLFAFLELADLLFHHEGDREGLSSSEAIFLPLMVGTTFDQTVWGVVIAMMIASIADRRVDLLKGTFNVANLGCAAAAGAGIWAAFAEDAALLSVRNVFVAVSSVLVFSLLTHVFVAVVISLSQRRRLALMSETIMHALGWNVAGNIALGVFLAAAFLLDRWLVLLFPFPLALLYFAYRAVVNQRAERQRAENLLSASRALASSPSLEDAVVEFLKAVQDIASAAEARVIVDTHRHLAWSGVRGETVIADMQALEDGPMRDLLTAVERKQRALIVGSGSRDEAETSLLAGLGASDLLAVPLVEGDAVVGCLAAIDRLGADEFGHSEARLLEALGLELVLTLDSYRLFAEVSEERERFRRIFSASKEGIALLDDSAIVRAWNPALSRISGYEAIEVIGHPWSDRVVVRDRRARRIEKMAIVEVPADEELELVSRDGPSRWISVLSSPVQGAQDKGWVILVRDVTAEHLVEESKSDFLSTVSHELRTPLTAIKGSVSMLQKGRDTLQGPMYDRMVDVLARGTSRLERLVLNLLFVSQVEADGAPRVMIEEFDIQKVIVERAGAIAGDHPITYPEADPVLIKGDRERTGQIIEHLVENAVKFDPDGRIVIELVRESGLARLTVRDSGPGIPRADQERIFERFVRLGDVLTRQTQGPGVGLFIVQKSAEAMGGEVWVESQPGTGSAFHVTFPLAQPMVIEGGASAS